MKKDKLLVFNVPQDNIAQKKQVVIINLAKKVHIQLKDKFLVHYVHQELLQVHLVTLQMLKMQQLTLVLLAQKVIMPQEKVTLFVKKFPQVAIKMQRVLIHIKNVRLEHIIQVKLNHHALLAQQEQQQVLGKQNVLHVLMVL